MVGIADIVVIVDIVDNVDFIDIVDIVEMVDIVYIVVILELQYLPVYKFPLNVFHQIFLTNNFPPNISVQFSQVSILF